MPNKTKRKTTLPGIEAVLIDAPPVEQLAKGVFVLEQAWDEEHKRRSALKHYRRAVRDAIDLYYHRSLLDPRDRDGNRRRWDAMRADFNRLEFAPKVSAGFNPLGSKDSDPSPWETAALQSHFRPGRMAKALNAAGPAARGTGRHRRDLRLRT